MSAADDTVPRFIAQIIAIVVASRLLGLLARRIGQPMVIAEVTAGILLGPSLLGYLFPSIYGKLFAPESLDLVHAVSQLGLVLFMFLVGLELDPDLLRGRGGASVRVAAASIIVPLILGIALAIHLRPPLAASGVPLPSFALFLGAAMSVTAFPVLARILAEKRLLRSRLGVLALACAAVADVSAWCMLAFVVAMARATGLREAMHTTWMAAAYVAAMFWLVRPLFVRIGARVNTAEALSQNVVAVVLLLLLASSWTTEWIGIHALFGAFIFGTVLPKSGGFARALTEKIEDLVLILLLPLFFAYSGLRTEIALLDSASAWATCLLIIAVACVGKFAAASVAARASGLAWREAGAIGALMNARGLMELIVLNVGLDLGVITPTLFTMMVLMALVTTFMASPLLQVIYPTTELTPALLPEPEVPADGRPFTTLVCVADRRSGPGLIIVAHALQPHERGSDTYALHVVPISERSSLLFDRSPEKRGEGELQPLMEQARSLGVRVKPLSFISSDPAADICRVAEAKRADLILLGGHRPVFSRARLGGIVADTLKAARSDVGVLIDRGVSELKSILVLYRGTPHDRTLLELALRAVVAEITVLYPARDVAREELASMLARDSRRAVELRGYDGPSTEAILAEAAREPDLVIVGVGSDWDEEEREGGIHPERLIRECPTSVLLVRHGSFRKTEAETRQRDETAGSENG